MLFTILPPIWQRAWFRVLAMIVIAGAGYLAYHSRVRHLLAIERMRSRIATDLHDDLGARLSRISILSEVAARRVASDAPSAERLLGEVGETARSLIEATADITWSVDPAQDALYFPSALTPGARPAPTVQTVKHIPIIFIQDQAQNVTRKLVLFG